MENSEIKTMLTVTADNYNGRVVSYDRWKRFILLCNKYPHVTFEELVTLAYCEDLIIYKQDIKSYLIENFRRFDNMWRITRGVIE